MASLIEVKTGNRRGFKIAFYGSDRKKRTLWLGDIDKEDATEFKLNVEKLIRSRTARAQPPKKIAAWLAEQEKHHIERLVRAGLLDPTSTEANGPQTLGELCDEYLAARTSIARRTKLALEQAIDYLKRHFKEKRPLSEFTVLCGLRFREWCLTKGRKIGREGHGDGIAEATARKYCQRARQIFAYATKRGVYSGENPFSSIPTSSVANPERQFFVTQAVALKAIESAPNAHWRALIALSRFAGLRVPSELTTLRWADVDLANRSLTIRALKTGTTRVCPIFSELRPYLEDLESLAQPGIETPLTALVIPFMDRDEKNGRSEFLRILKRAAITPWERLFHNMRASRETELLARFPMKDVTDWLGNSQGVAMRHYAMATSESFQRAIDEPVAGCSAGCSITNGNGANIADTSTIENAENAEKCTLVSSGDKPLTTAQYSLEGSNL